MTGCRLLIHKGKFVLSLIIKQIKNICWPLSKAWKQFSCQKLSSSTHALQYTVLIAKTQNVRVLNKSNVHFLNSWQRFNKALFKSAAPRQMSHRVTNCSSLNFFLGLFCFTSSSGSSWTNAMSPLRCDQFYATRWSHHGNWNMMNNHHWNIMTSWISTTLFSMWWICSKLHHLLTAVRNKEKHIET